LNEFEEIRFQAFVPTKSLSHIRSALEAIVKSLSDHGLPQPILGFTDNVAADARTFMQCIPALAKNVNAIQLDEFADFPRLRLPSDVKVVTCSTEAEIRSACSTVLELLLDDQMTLQLGGDSEWEFSTEKAIGGSRKTALFTIALPTVVYLLRVCKVKTLPTSLRTLLMSRQIILVGRNISSDLKKIVKRLS